MTSGLGLSKTSIEMKIEETYSIEALIRKKLIDIYSSPRLDLSVKRKAKSLNNKLVAN